MFHSCYSGGPEILFRGIILISLWPKLELSGLTRKSQINMNFTFFPLRENRLQRKIDMLSNPSSAFEWLCNFG